jgi:hypothetical protein
LLHHPSRFLRRWDSTATSTHVVIVAPPAAPLRPAARGKEFICSSPGTYLSARVARLEDVPRFASGSVWVETQTYLYRPSLPRRELEPRVTCNTALSFDSHVKLLRAPSCPLWLMFLLLRVSVPPW